MKENNTVIMILGGIFSIAVVIACIYGALTAFGVHIGGDAGNLIGVIVLFIPVMIISGIIFWIIDKFFNISSESFSMWIYLFLVLFIWGVIAIQAIS